MPSSPAKRVPSGIAVHTGMRPGSARLGRKADRLTVLNVWS